MKQPRGAAGGDLLFFIFFIIVLGIVWALTGGPDRAISRSGPFLNPPFPLGNESGYSVSNFNIPSVGTPSSGRTQEREEEEQNSLENLISRIRLGFGELKEEKSPYAGQVTLSVGRAKSSDPDDEYVIIKTTTSVTDRVVVSSWRIESSVTSYGTTIGDASYLPYSGQVNVESTVAVPANTTLYITTGRSPIGASFRTNTCTGYFAQFQDFEPKLKEECPLPESELTDIVGNDFVPNDACIDFVEDIERCTLTLTQIPGGVGSQCSNFVIEDLSYSGCVALHKDDADFYKNEWRMYLDRDQELWKSTRERIRLLDENGKVIAAVSY